MRYIFVENGIITDSMTDQVLSLPELESVLLQKPGGIISGTNLYPILASLMPMVKHDEGWSATLKLQQKKRLKTKRVGGVIYFTRLTYRFPKQRKNKVRYRPGSIKWLVLNLELFNETLDVKLASEELVRLAIVRGVSLRHSPGSFAGAMLRASREWEKGRGPAPWFISDIARTYLPGNFYAKRHGCMYTIPTAYYLDQQSSHHNIASQIPIPHPSFIRARGRLRSVEKGRSIRWVDVSLLQNHVGMIHATVECDLIPPTKEHLYPTWCRQRGVKKLWIWTPDLRLLDRRVRIVHISAALTSVVSDPVVREYAEWSLEQLEISDKCIKPSLLAAYGLLGVKSDREIDLYSITGQKSKGEQCSLPLIDDCYRSTIKNVRVSVIQNVVARGVIEAETRARSIEFARNLESIGIQVSQIYADGLIAVTDSLPFLPPGWRVSGELSNVKSPSPNTIIADNMIRMPGIPSGRRSARIGAT